MGQKYLSDEDLDRKAKWISVKNLKKLLETLPDGCGIETSDLCDLLISTENNYVGYITLLEGKGEFVTFQSLMDSLG